MDIGIYTLYPMVALFGMPERILSDVLTCTVPTEEGPMRTDLQGNALFTYPGMDACVCWSKIADSNLPTEISADGGILHLDQVHITRNVLLTPRGAPTSGRGNVPQAQDISVPTGPDVYLCEFRAFIDVLEKGGTESVHNSLSVSVDTARIMDEIRRQAGIVFPADRTTT